MSDLKRHNVFSLPDEPDWTNSDGVKWWGLDIGDPQDGQAVYVEFPNGDAKYAILTEKHGIIYDTNLLENILFEFDKYKLIRTLK